MNRLREGPRASLPEWEIKLFESPYFWIAGRSKPIRTGVVATTTSSSMSVKPMAFLIRFTVFFMMITPFKLK